MNKFIFNNADSYTDFEVLMKDYPQLPLPTENVEDVKVDGRSGTLTFKDGTYSNLMLPINLILKNKSRLNEVLEWLNNIKDNRLYFNVTDEKCYKVKRVSISSIQHDVLECINVSCTFILEPFIVPVEEFFKSISKGETINYRGIKTEPLVKIVASGNVQLSINDNIMQLNSCNGTIIIDSENLTVRSDAGQSLLDKTTGNFFTFENGKNVVTWVGSITKCEVLYNTKYGW